jgi:starvation-inducible DNA-binding protein
MNKHIVHLCIVAYTINTVAAKEPVSITAKNNVKSENKKHMIAPEPNIGLEKNQREGVSALLNDLLSDHFTFYVKSLNYHWNVESHHFNDLHALFKSIYEKQSDICDELAERVRALGHVSFGTMQEFSKASKIEEAPGKKLSDQEMIKQLLEDLELIIRTIRTSAKECDETYDDAGTNNLLLNLLEKQEKTAWMLRASLVK